METILTPEQQERYSRNLLLKEVGEQGQLKLLNSKVLVLGCGALGSIAAMYLAGSGTGSITLVDFDTVSLSNLQRQLSFSSSQIGQSKAEALRKRLLEINPEISVTAVNQRLTPDHARTLFSGQDLVLEGSDSPEAKHFTALICKELAKPYIIGGVYDWSGQVLTCLPESAGYLDLFPEPNAEEGAPGSRVGVLGPLPGVIGSLQAAEAIKLITGAGRPLTSRMLLIDLLSATTQVIDY